MAVCPDYEDLFKKLNAYNIRYLVVGAHAVIYYTTPRYTKDIDVWIIPDLNDSNKVFAALAAFGAPLKGLTPKDFENPRLIFQIGVAPVRIDIITTIEGPSFAQAWRHRVRTRYGSTAINIIGYNELIKAKQAANRDQDRIDIQTLKANARRQRKPNQR